MNCTKYTALILNFPWVTISSSVMVKMALQYTTIFKRPNPTKSLNGRVTVSQGLCCRTNVDYIFYITIFYTTLVLTQKLICISRLVNGCVTKIASRSLVVVVVHKTSSMRFIYLSHVFVGDRLWNDVAMTSSHLVQISILALFPFFSCLRFLAMFQGRKLFLVINSSTREPKLENNAWKCISNVVLVS